MGNRSLRIIVDLCLCPSSSSHDALGAGLSFSDIRDMGTTYINDLASYGYKRLS